MKILVVDDHPLVREAMAQLVAQLGGPVDVLQAQDCTSGLAAARAHPDLDLVLLDLNLPGLRTWPLTKYPYLIFYIELDQQIDVWRVLHMATDIPNWMTEG